MSSRAAIGKETTSELNEREKKIYRNTSNEAKHKAYQDKKQTNANEQKTFTHKSNSFQLTLI